MPTGLVSRSGTRQPIGGNFEANACVDHGRFGTTDRPCGLQCCAGFLYVASKRYMAEDGCTCLSRPEALRRS